MRITKVKVDQKNVLMLRDSQEGFLKHGEEDKKKSEINNFLKLKEKSFIESIINKTVVKKIGKENRSNLEKIKLIFEYLLNKENEEFKKDNNKRIREFDLSEIKELNEDDVKNYLNHKFQEKVEFNALGKKELFLPTILHKSLGENKNIKGEEALKEIVKKLHLYQTWAKSYISNKQKHLAKSLSNNKIDYKEGSPRKEALKIWANELKQWNNINFEKLIKDFKLEELSTKWLTDFEKKKSKHNKMLRMRKIKIV